MSSLHHTLWKAALLLAFLLTAAFGQSDKDLNQKCAKYKDVDIPKRDEPTEEDKSSQAMDCSPLDSYYGFDAPSDAEDARRCALLQVTGQRRATSYTPLVLTMIYANGKGAARNFDVALRFACEAVEMSPELKSSVEHIEKLKAQHWNGSNYDVCDGIPDRSASGSDGMVVSFCSEKRERFAAAVRHKQLLAIRAKWSAADTQAFAKLQKSANDFFESRSDLEVDQSGSGRFIMVSSERSGLDRDFESALLRFETGTMPHFTSAEFAKADAELNTLYNGALKEAARPDRKGTITADGIRTTERAWLHYLVAWVAFARQKYPQVTADSWRCWLTQERIKQLHELPLGY
jgi:uncharacterized protein YecT (DUF1311 family)